MRNAFAVTILYFSLTIALTWPLARGLTRDIPGDFGDPLFTSWVMAWDATHLGRGWWSANIFAPHPLALAYSEHFLPQGIQALPFYRATNNPILGYNLVFLSTFVLSGLGMFLLGRELTGSRSAGVIAGLAYAFSPFRIASIPHLQVLSSAWMPFVLYGLRRHFATGRLPPLAGAAAAWIVQNLSCGYYMLFFSPVVVIYIAWELTTRGLWTDRRALIRAAAACAVVFIATAPFVLPYLELRRLGFSPRSLTETKRFSADVYAYFTADPSLRFWGPRANAWPKAEGLLFPGLTIVVLAACGAAGRRAGARSAPEALRHSALHRILTAVVIGCWLAVLLLLFGGSIRLPVLKITELPRAMVVAAAASAALLAASAAARSSFRRWLASPSGIFSIITVFAAAMSLGPEIRAKGRVVADVSLYTMFYDFVPGFDGVRVPARYGMIVTLGLAALAAVGISRLSAVGTRQSAAIGSSAVDRRRRQYASVIAGSLIVLEATAMPIPINQNSTEYAQRGLAPLPPFVATGDGAPAVYRFIAALPPSSVVVELPLGEPAFDVRYMFYSTLHWKRLVNGYSGGGPQQYEFLREAMNDVATRPDRAWQAIADSTATHAVVHEGAYEDERGRRFGDFLRARGARDVAAFGTDRVFALH
jgi:hypothetical protein